MKITDDRVSVELIKPVTVTEAGLVIPLLEDERPTEGIVVEVGPGKRNEDGDIIPMTLKVGEKVMFAAGSGLAVTVQGRDLTIFKESEILAVVE